MFGWPTVGAVGHPGAVTKSTVISIITNIALLGFLIAINQFTLINIAIVRVITEFILFITRFMSFLKYKNEFMCGEEV